MDNSKYYGEDGIVLFVREVIGADPTPYQEDILRRMARNNRPDTGVLPIAAGKTTLITWYNKWASR